MKFLLLCVCIAIAVNGICGQSSRSRIIGPERPPSQYRSGHERYGHERSVVRHTERHVVDRPERPQRPQRPSPTLVEEDNTARETESGHRHHVDDSDHDMSEDDVQSVVCSEADIPERQIMDFDKCTRHIPAYRVRIWN